MKALIEAELFRQIEHDRRRITRTRRARRADDAVVIRQAPAAPRGRPPPRPPPPPPPPPLAMLARAPRPHGPILVAEREGVLVAAVPLGGGRAIADPFEPTAGIV